MTEDSAKIKLNKLMCHAKKNLWMEKEDKYYVLNSLLDLFGFDAPAPDNSDENRDFNIDDIQAEIIDPRYKKNSRPKRNEYYLRQK